MEFEDNVSVKITQFVTILVDRDVSGIINQKVFLVLCRITYLV